MPFFKPESVLSHSISRAAEVTCATEGGSGFFYSIVFHFHERVPRGRKAPA